MFKEYGAFKGVRSWYIVSQNCGQFTFGVHGYKIIWEDDYSHFSNPLSYVWQYGWP